ncbi:MAG: Gfo/Idh/MocA family oxidoreductase [Gemmatales bacterium]|nr:Gfo/Idh/MocA family oxidoreductase [Gemmatales bacterium]MDW8222146.1 Gfo/Idh/MocA family oxidoreductase [Gemmatales bacterium]
MNQANRTTAATRREFLRTTAAGTAAAMATLRPWEHVPAVHLAGSDVLKVGLIGCGGRGTGAAYNCLRADPHTRLIALADLFRDRLEGSLSTLKSNPEINKQVEVTPDRCFVGFNAYRELLSSGVDIVLLCTPPHFRPAHLQAAVEAGKHIFAEKPVAVDAPGVRKVLAACELAKQKGLAVVSGLCWRYHHGMRETMKRVHDGAIGDIVTMQCTYNVGYLWVRTLAEKQKYGWSDMEWQCRNWLYFTWLSGDHIVEQHIHSLDKMAWAMRNQYPIRCWGMGGRQVRVEPDYGHIFDHHAVVYEFPGGVRLYSFCRQQNGTHSDVSDQIFGTQGTCDIQASRSDGILLSRQGQRLWSSRQAVRGRDDMYQNELDEMLASIRAGRPINDGDWMTKSTLMAIMGRMATYTGKLITWEMALNSKEDLTPPKYEFGPLPVPPVAKPGVTPFV